MPVNDIDHFVLTMGDKATVPAKELVDHFNGLIHAKSFAGNEVDFPANGTAAGTRGQWAVNATHLAFCVAPNTWVRVALVAW